MKYKCDTNLKIQSQQHRIIAFHFSIKQIMDFGKHGKLSSYNPSKIEIDMYF